MEFYYDFNHYWRVGELTFGIEESQLLDFNKNDCNHDYEIIISIENFSSYSQMIIIISKKF